MTQRFVTTMAVCLVTLTTGSAFAQGYQTWTKDDVVVRGSVYMTSETEDFVNGLVLTRSDLFVVAPSGTVTEQGVFGSRSKTDPIEITYKDRTFFAEAFAFSFSDKELTIEGVSVSPNLEN